MTAICSLAFLCTDPPNWRLSCLETFWSNSIRSSQYAEGLPDVLADKVKGAPIKIANRIASNTFILAALLMQNGVEFSIENPASSAFPGLHY